MRVLRAGWTSRSQSQCTVTTRRADAAFGYEVCGCSNLRASLGGRNPYRFSHSGEPSLSLLGLSLPHHSLTFHCLITAFPLPFLDRSPPSPPFLDLQLPFLDFSPPFTDLPLSRSQGLLDRLMQRLLEGGDTVAATLFKADPFADGPPPKLCRAQLL